LLLNLLDSQKHGLFPYPEKSVFRFLAKKVAFSVAKLTNLRQEQGSYPVNQRICALVCPEIMLMFMFEVGSKARAEKVSPF